MGLGVLLTVFGVLAVVVGWSAPAPGSSGFVPARFGASLPTSAPAASATASTLQLSVSATPGAICAAQESTCRAGVGESRVRLSATATPPTTLAWPAVQVAFVVETTAYDGIFPGNLGDGTYGLDPCGATGGPVCEESNGIPFFVANARNIASAIQQANPHSQVSFALVDYYDSWGSQWDDQDGPEYHVDIGQFVDAGTFGSEVPQTFQQYVMAGQWYNWDQDLDNNFLDSSSITAVYGAIVGSQLNWANNTHHVVVWMGSTAPRDPSYPENYCVSPSQWNLWSTGKLPCTDQSCEPSYQFTSGASPQCEGWVRSQDGNPYDSIAGLAHHAPSCTNSIGGVCTIDTIDLWTTPTDPYSIAWPKSYSSIGGGPGGAAVLQDSARILQAGCDLAAATGGTWSGPSYASCPDGRAGTLQYVNHGPINTPNTQNPTLMEAFRQIGFGPVYETAVAQGTTHPLFEYVPIGSIVVAPDAQWAAACATPSGFESTCQTTPSVLRAGGYTYFGWNWSTVPTRNVLVTGDSWSAEFNVMATGPPYAAVPVDACTTLLCRIAGSGPVGGVYTSATYIQNGSVAPVEQSFPLATVTVQHAPPAPGPPTSPPPPPPIPPPPPLLAPVGIPVPTLLALTAQVGVANISLQATAAGFLGAGFMRVSLKNRPIAMKVAAKSGLVKSKFEGSSQTDGAGRFE